MMNDRRKFLQNASLLAAGYLLVDPLKSAAGNSALGAGPANTIAIMHTSNIHGRLTPFSYGQLHNIGGLHNVQQVIQQHGYKPVMVDAGGFLHSKSSLNDDISAIRQMNKAGYVAVTVNEDDLAKGEEYLATLAKYMRFTIVNCNYAFSHAALKDVVKPYNIVQYGQYKVGITGVGDTKTIKVANPYNQANEMAAYLKNQQHCNLVICLSTLGLGDDSNKFGNKNLAGASANIDVIIGGHKNEPSHPQLVLSNREKQQVIVSNGGYGGSVIGALQFTFNESKKLQAFNCKNYIPGRDAGASFYQGFKQLSA